MVKTFTKTYEINYYDVDYKLNCKMSSIINFICDVGTQQSEAIGGGMEYCKKNNCAWVFYKYDINNLVVISNLNNEFQDENNKYLDTNILPKVLKHYK